MNIIKLDAIDSTSSYLKSLVKSKQLPNYTVVVANKQIKGRGQMGTSWHAQEGKNLTFSMLINLKTLKIEHQFYLSMAISMAVVYVVKKYVKNKISIKWPNDILAEGDKIAGILIENKLKGPIIKQAVVGIGLNVNQEDFPINLGSVNSLINLREQTINTEVLLSELVDAIKGKMELVLDERFDLLKSSYLKMLFNYQKPAMYQDTEKNMFLAKIIDITDFGKLVLLHDDESCLAYNFKEIKLVQRKK